MRSHCYFRLPSALLLIGAWILMSVLFFRADNSLTVCLQGIAYTRQNPDLTSLSCNILYHIGFALLLGTGLWRDRDENNEMSLVRYGSYRRYYNVVYRKAVLTSLLYDVLSFAGLLAGELLDFHFNGNPVQAELLADMVSLYLCSHLFWGLLIAWSIIERGNMRLSFLLYPGIYLFTIVLSRSLPKRINRWLPGNWMMLYRSDRYQNAGYSRPAVRIILLSAFVLLAVVNAVKKKNTAKYK